MLILTNIESSPDYGIHSYQKGYKYPKVIRYLYLTNIVIAYKYASKKSIYTLPYFEKTILICHIILDKLNIVKQHTVPHENNLCKFCYLLESGRNQIH